MSQQSTLKMMLPYYERWMKKFPTLNDLASVSESELLKMWEGLGYYSRARNILKAAQLIRQQKAFPSTSEELLTVPGIGPYTAAAIAAIAFGEKTLPVDGNVIRVFSRLNGIANPLNNAEDRAAIYRKVSESAELLETFSAPERGDIAQAYMELGATLCKPAAIMDPAYCAHCPLSQNCRAHREGKVLELPQTKLRAKMKKIDRLLVLYRSPEGEPLLRKRSDAHSVLAGQWELPYIDFHGGAGPEKWMEKTFLPHFELHKAFKHTIMNTQYQIWWVEAGRIKSPLPAHQFYNQICGEPLTTITRKALRI